MVDRHFDRFQDENRAKVSIFATEKEEVDRDSSGRRKRGEFRRSHNSKQTQLGYEIPIYRSTSYAGRRIAREYLFDRGELREGGRPTISVSITLHKFDPFILLHSIVCDKKGASHSAADKTKSRSLWRSYFKGNLEKNLMKQVFFSVYATLDVKVTNWSQFSLPRCQCSDQFWWYGRGNG